MRNCIQTISLGVEFNKISRFYLPTDYNWDCVSEQIESEIIQLFSLISELYTLEQQSILEQNHNSQKRRTFAVESYLSIHKEYRPPQERMCHTWVSGFRAIFVSRARRFITNLGEWLWGRECFRVNLLNLK